MSSVENTVHLPLAGEFITTLHTLHYDAIKPIRLNASLDDDVATKLPNKQ